MSYFVKSNWQISFHFQDKWPRRILCLVAVSRDFWLATHQIRLAYCSHFCVIVLLASGWCVGSQNTRTYLSRIFFIWILSERPSVSMQGTFCGYIQWIRWLYSWRWLVYKPLLNATREREKNEKSAKGAYILLWFLLSFVKSSSPIFICFIFHSAKNSTWLYSKQISVFFIHFSLTRCQSYDSMLQHLPWNWIYYARITKRFSAFDCMRTLTSTYYKHDSFVN